MVILSACIEKVGNLPFGSKICFEHNGRACIGLTYPKHMSDDGSIKVYVSGGLGYTKDGLAIHKASLSPNTEVQVLKKGGIQAEVWLV